MKAGEIVLICLLFAALLVAFAILAFLLLKDRRRQRTRIAAPTQNVAKKEQTVTNGDLREIRNDDVYEEVY
ncbi:unnamed protein product [Cylicocyclus nassatus]|uniref:Uncharacterized protein n=1 Tax=Cylicocyclus nassatus TaxID=53992 RepID=A0AA36GJR9_CYLNA|nr:unnamed protein product [Cylicocyclus nassatus]